MIIHYITNVSLIPGARRKKYNIVKKADKTLKELQKYRHCFHHIMIDDNYSCPREIIIDAGHGT
jgi:hypothetical protein